MKYLEKLIHEMLPEKLNFIDFLTLICVIINLIIFSFVISPFEFVLNVPKSAIDSLQYILNYKVLLVAFSVSIIFCIINILQIRIYLKRGKHDHITWNNISNKIYSFFFLLYSFYITYSLILFSQGRLNLNFNEIMYHLISGMFFLGYFIEMMKTVFRKKDVNELQYLYEKNKYIDYIRNKFKDKSKEEIEKELLLLNLIEATAKQYDNNIKIHSEEYEKIINHKTYV